ncbi:hypothetical protein JZ785_00625 [Alicyclobacillus curvatus]|nr:hypothetical protein JZ785_00625 [Alicyclobacillus curvatus]
MVFVALNSGRNFLVKFKLIIAATLVTVVVTGCGHNSLASAIGAEWKVPFQIQMVDTKKDAVIFKDDNQYVFNTFQMINGKYKYSTNGEDGWTFSGDILFRAISRPTVGDVVWGVIKTGKKSSEIQMVFTNQTDPSTKVRMDSKIRNNCFIAYPSVQFFNNGVGYAQNWNAHVTVYDSQGEIILDENLS